VGTKAALLQALFAGPADSVALARRLARPGLGRFAAGSPEIGRSLRELVRCGLLRTWLGRARRSPGKRTAYYELTLAGVAEAEVVREALKGLTADARSRRGRTGGKAVDRRLKRSLDISAVAGALRRRGAGSTPGR
jgi:DNA-binding PadR family transcriptional regulator